MNFSVQNILDRVNLSIGVDHYSTNILTPACHSDCNVDIPECDNGYDEEEVDREFDVEVEGGNDQVH